ncbi:hypothetical protein [Isoptericola rhizosphaerae]|uniref:hypothetical protein n=1 Tax=Isoptericola rhizosphaerae TaxID=3377837 RepID=UPI00383B039B
MVGSATPVAGTETDATGDLGPPTFDRWVRYRELDELRTALEAGDASRLVRTFEALDTETASLAAWLLFESADLEGLVEEVLVDRPQDVLARTLLAGRHVVLAWEARSGARVQDVSADQLERFRAHLVRAESILSEVCAGAPDQVLAWELRLTTARGLGLGLTEARRRYDRIADLVPGHWRAQDAYLQQVLPKWGGSWERAEAFVAECAAAAPAGSPSRALVANLQVERWLATGDGTFLDDATVAELRLAAREVLGPDAATGPATDAVHARLALLFTFAERSDDAAPHFAVLGTDPVPDGWEHLDDAAGWYARSRAQALGAAVVPDAPGAPSRTRRRWLRVLWGVSMAFLVVMLALCATGVVVSVGAVSRGEPGAVVRLVVLLAATGLAARYLWQGARPGRRRAKV